MSKKAQPFIPFTLDNAWIVEFPTQPAGVLRLGPGKVRMEAAFRARQVDEEGWVAVIDCDLCIPDADGRVWQATGSFLSNGLFHPLIDLARAEPGRWLHNAPHGWRKALEQPMLADVTATYDDRFYRLAWVDNTGFCWQFKYFGAKFDLAALDEPTIVVRVHNLWCKWNPLSVMGPDGPRPVPPRRASMSRQEQDEEDERQRVSGKQGRVDEARPLAYVIDAGRLLFRNTACYREDEDWWYDGPVSRPLVFRRTRRKGERQGHVGHPAGTAPTACPSPGGEGGFVPLGVGRGETQEFLTGAGGMLIVGSQGSYRVKVEKHPDSAGEPADVPRKRVRLTDETGTVWEAVTHCTPEVFFERLYDLELNGPFGDDEELPASERVELAGIRAVLDDGAWRCALFRDGLVAFQGNGQRPVVHLTSVRSGFAATITGLVGRQRAVAADDDDYFVLAPRGRRSNRRRGRRTGLCPL